MKLFWRVISVIGISHLVGQRYDDPTLFDVELFGYFVLVVYFLWPHASTRIHIKPFDMI